MRFAFFVLLLTGSGTSVFAQEIDLEKLDQYFATARTSWKVPGMSVALVQNGELSLARGYGVRELGGARSVDADTLFAIASNSKAFTAAALAILVDEGKIGWDDRVRDHLPYFELYSPFVTEEMRIRDLLCHRSGLGTFSGDLLWYLTSYDREEVIRRTRFLAPAGPFRASYGYSNLMFIAAGEVIPSVTGQSWETFVRERILQPIGMTRTVLSVAELQGVDNVATPHADFDGDLTTFPWVSWKAMAPAGGIISSANDMALWLKLQLDRGTWAGKRIFSETSSRTMWSQHNILSVSPQSEYLYPSTHFRGYGLGWSLFDYGGEKVVAHGGAYDGMFSQVVLVPGKNLGLVVLTNSTTRLQSALMYRVLDMFLGGEERDWSEIFLQQHISSKEADSAKRLARAQSRISGTRPSLPPEEYVGRYGGAMYGDAEVRLENGKLVLQFLPAPELHGELVHWHYDTFEIQWHRRFPWFGRGTVQFLLDADGRVSEFKMNVPNEDFWFQELEFKRK